MLALDAAKAYVRYDGRKLRFHLFSEELPPLLVVGGKNAHLIAKILREELGSYVDGGTEVISIKPLTAPAVLVWIAASSAGTPSRDLLRALIARTPKPLVDLIFELIDVSDGFRKDKPLIEPRKLRRASKILIKVLDLLGYPVKEAKSG